MCNFIAMKKTQRLRKNRFLRANSHRIESKLKINGEQAERKYYFSLGL